MSKQKIESLEDLIKMDNDLDTRLQGLNFANQSGSRDGASSCSKLCTEIYLHQEYVSLIVFNIFAPQRKK